MRAASLAIFFENRQIFAQAWTLPRKQYQIVKVRISKDV